MDSTRKAKAGRPLPKPEPKSASGAEPGTGPGTESGAEPLPVPEPEPIAARTTAGTEAGTGSAPGTGATAGTGAAAAAGTGAAATAAATAPAAKVPGPRPAPPWEQLWFGTTWAAAGAVDRLRALPGATRSAALGPAEALLRRLAGTGPSGAGSRLFLTPFGMVPVVAGADQVRSLFDRWQSEGLDGAAYAVDHLGRRRPLPSCPPILLDPRDLSEEIEAAAAAEADWLIGERNGDGNVPWSAWREAADRLARHAVLGRRAALDTVLGEILAHTEATDGSAMDSEAAVTRRIAEHLTIEVDGCAAARLAKDGLDRDEVAAAVRHLLTASTRGFAELLVTATALDALGHDGTLPGAEAEAAVAETVRLWPPLPMTLHRSDTEFVWEGRGYEAGTEVLVLAGAAARDGAAFADPGVFRPGTAARDGVDAVLPAPFCGGMADCAASGLAMALAAAMVRALRVAAEPRVTAPAPLRSAVLDGLDPHGIRVAFTDYADGPYHGYGIAHLDGSVRSLVAAGAGAQRYAEVAATGAERLMAFAEQLRESAAGPTFTAPGRATLRAALLEHAQRCEAAANDARRCAVLVAGR
ncbi:cytochrome P450 [Catenulispora yoronensis]|uniref:cytochrome P450 n=1 Tax=Catenulispora yoronensis TaxID=450799 RepID=UPI0031CE2B8F